MQRISGWLLVSLLHGLSGAFLIGYCVIFFNVPYDTIRANTSSSSSYISDLEWAIINALYNFGGFVSALASGKLADRIGRKKTLLLMDCAHIIASLLVATSTHMAQLLVGRLMTGFACGIGTVLCGMYLNEVAPPRLSGVFGSSLQIVISFGILTSVALGKLFQTDPFWRYGALLPGVLSLIRICLCSKMLESPEWLRKEGRDDEANEVEMALRGSRQTQHTREAVAEKSPPTSVATPGSTQTPGPHGMKGMSAYFEVVAGESAPFVEGTDECTSSSESESYARILFCSLTLPAIGHVGIGSVVFYSAEIINEITALNSWIASLALFTSFFLGSLIIVFVVDKIGRRLLLIMSSAGVAVTLSVLTAMFVAELNVAIITCLVAFMIFFQLGLGPLPFFYIAELSPIEVRSTMMSYGLAVMWIFDLIVAFATPLMVEAMGDFVFVPSVAATAVGALLIYLFFPETKQQVRDAESPPISGI